MKKVFAVIAVLIALCGLSYSENSFDTELSGLRKSVISMCTQLQAGQPRENQEQLLKEIDAIISGWKGLTDNYNNTPPVEYAKDPAWKSYFDEALDNFQIMRQKVEGKDYNRATQFCGLNCALFVKIHQVNGISTLTDKMFTLRQHLKLTLSMAKASNWAGAKEIMENASKDLQEIKKLAIPANVDKKEYLNDIKLLDDAFAQLKSIFNMKDIKKFGEQFKTFLNTFNKLYLKYI